MNLGPALVMLRGGGGWVLWWFLLMSPTSEIENSESYQDWPERCPADLPPLTGGPHCRSWPQCAGPESPEEPHCGSCRILGRRKRPAGPGGTEGRGAGAGRRRRAGRGRRRQRGTCSHSQSSWQTRTYFNVKKVKLSFSVSPDSSSLHCQRVVHGREKFAD